MANTEWFQAARFGMFIHWGLYAVPAKPGKGEWYASIDRVPPETYRKYFDLFRPTDFDPASWARDAKRAGMQYAVLTAKHHEGFCLFDSAYTDYKSTNTAAGRDLVREFLDAFRAEGLRVGLYYSLVDWHHPDYPAYNDPFHPMRGDESRKEESCDFSRYLDYMHAQVRELCTNYGKLDLFWFDFSYEGHTGTDWRGEELVETVRSLQPGILLNSRLEASGGELGSLLTDTPTPWAGDFAAPEQILPPAPLVTPSGRPVCWEANQTMNNSFGYTEGDKAYKGAPVHIRQLVECVSKGGNYLLNVGPDAKGNFPPEARRTLREMGEWMRLNGESIYGCGPGSPAEAFGCRTTAKGNKLYLHVMHLPVGPMPVSGIRPEEIKYARLLSTGAEVEVLSEGWAVQNYPGYTFLNLGVSWGEAFPMPAEADLVVELTLRD